MPEAFRTGGGYAGVFYVLGIDLTLAFWLNARKLEFLAKEFGELLHRHIDLEEVRLDEVIESKVAVRFEGTSKGVKMGGMLDEVTREVTVKGVVTSIPEHLVLDITDLGLGDAGHVADLQVPEGLEILDEPDTVLCSVLVPRKAEIEEEVEEGAEEAVEEAAAEPEIISKRKEEEAE